MLTARQKIIRGILCVLIHTSCFLCYIYHLKKSLETGKNQKNLNYQCYRIILSKMTVLIQNYLYSDMKV